MTGKPSRTLLDAAALARRVASLDGWTYADRAIGKTFTFASFRDAIAFVVRLAFEAEAADHHPDVAIHYRDVELRYWTHSAGGVTELDIIGAAAADEVHRGFGGRSARPGP